MREKVIIFLLIMCSSVLLSNSNNKKAKKGNGFVINQIEILDDESILNSSKANKLKKLYTNRELDGSDINALIGEATNILLEEGYITSRVTIEPNQNISKGTLKLRVVPGEIENIVLNSNSSFDKAKVFTSIPRNKVLNLTDIEQGIDQFNRVSSNKADIKVVPGNENNKSILSVTNEERRTYNIKVGFNNSGSKETGKNKVKVVFTKNNLFEINDSLTFSYERSLKGIKDKPRGSLIAIKALKPGETLILTDMDKRMQKNSFSEEWAINFSAPFRYYTFNTGFSHSFSISSLEQYTGVYDLRNKNTKTNIGVSKVLYRKNRDKLTLSTELKVNRKTSILDDIQLEKRNQTIGTLGLNYGTVIFGGILNAELSYSFGLPIFNSLKDKGKSKGLPKAQFNKYNLSIDWQKPINNFLYFLSANMQYSRDTLYPTEKITIGGEGTVRGYGIDSFSADKGIYIRNELSYRMDNFFGRLTPYLGFDIGKGWNNYVSDKYKSGFASGITLGLKMSSDDFDFNLAVSKPIKGSEYLKKNKYEVSLKAEYRF